jgi:uncharacterized protein (DUF1778 family)
MQKTSPNTGQQREYTKERMLLSTVRISRREHELFMNACKIKGVSRSQFLRDALREKALRVMTEAIETTN